MMDRPVVDGPFDAVIVENHAISTRRMRPFLWSANSAGLARLALPRD